MTVAEVADLVGGRLVTGDAGRTVRCVAPTDEAGEDALTFVSDPAYLERLARSRAAAVLLAETARPLPLPAGLAVIAVDDPYLAFARAAQRLQPPAPSPPAGVHPSAVVDPSAILGAGVAVGALAYIGPRARVGADAVLHAGVHVEEDAVIGAETVLYNRVVVRHRCRVGARCCLHPGVVIGGDGFGFARGGPEGPVKIPQTGTVVVEDDVEIGANTTVDRGTFGATRVGRASKIDNLVQVGHNVSIGPGCILVAQSGVAGSSRLEAGAVMGAQSGVAGHCTIGAHATVYGQSGVMRDVAPHTRVAGTPAVSVSSFFRGVVRVRKLDEWVERVRDLERALRALSSGHDQTQS